MHCRTCTLDSSPVGKYNRKLQYKTTIIELGEGTTFNAYPCAPSHRQERTRADFPMYRLIIKSAHPKATHCTSYMRLYCFPPKICSVELMRIGASRLGGGKLGTIGGFQVWTCGPKFSGRRTALCCSSTEGSELYESITTTLNYIEVANKLHCQSLTSCINP